MRKWNLLIFLPLLSAGCAPPPAEPATILTPAPETVSVDATPAGEAISDPEATPLAEGAVNPLDPTANTPADATPAATVSSTPMADATPGAAVDSTPTATVPPEASSIILPTPTNVAPTPTPVPRTAKQEVMNFGGQLDKALLKQDCERVGAEAAKRSTFYEETQRVYKKDKDDEGVAYCQGARNSLDKIVLAAKTKTEILKGERYHTQMANVKQMIEDAINAAP